MDIILIAVIVVALATIGFVAYNYFKIKKMDEGTERMSEIAEAIRIGANAFINYEYKIIAIVAAIVAVVLGVLVCWEQAVCFVLGACMSAIAGFIGMKVATYANVRVSNAARTTKKLGETLKVAFRGGSVMGLSVAAFALVGMVIIYVVFGKGLGYMEAEAIQNNATNWLGISYTPFTQCLSGYALGCSFIAMFSRIGGGIYTKAADMGADLVGKTEASIPEDDPRNPATIADNVGDNVGDVAGLGSDLLESFVGSIASAVMLGVFVVLKGANVPVEILDKLFYYPLIFVTIGLVSCVLGVLFLLIKKASEKPHKELNIATWLSAALTVIFGLVATLAIFNDVEVAVMQNMGFKLGAWSPWVAAALGVASGILIGVFAEYYTSYDYNPTRLVSHAAEDGAALTITQGMAVGMKSCMAPLVVLAATLAIAYYTGGFFGVAMAGVGMLSFVGITVSVDTYGPISDNAGGIAEMSRLEPKVRAITDELDSVGNTTAAIGKGFAIGSAAFATLGLMISYIFSFSGEAVTLENVAMNIIDPLTLAGALVGAALPFLFSGMLIDAVAKAAKKMVNEVRRQFKEKPGILTGEEKPDYKTCIEISSHGALQEMRIPAIMSIVFPLASGFLFGPWFVAGVLMGGTLSAIMLAIFTGNAGGTWDNAKKYIETGAIEGSGKGSRAHKASVVGDTVGDPLKDTVGPSLDILIKIMSTVSLVAVPLFNQFNLISLFIK